MASARLLEKGLEQNPHHGKPKPLFLGVITYIYLGCKTLIFHGFGVQRHLLVVNCWQFTG